MYRYIPNDVCLGMLLRISDIFVFKCSKLNISGIICSGGLVKRKMMLQYLICVCVF